MRPPTPMLQTLDLKKHVGAIHVAGPLTLLQRKAANVLLLHAYDELPDDSVRQHSIRLADLARALAYDSNDHRTLKDALGTLVETRVEWNVLDPEGRREWGVSALLASARIVDGTGVCRYAYSDDLRRLLHTPAVYARINLAVQRRFTSQYALALYENCVRFRATGSTGWIALETWRGLLGVADGQYARYTALRRRVFEPAVGQVNEHSDLAVEMETRREGRHVGSVRFLVTGRPESPTATPPLAEGPGSPPPPDDLRRRLLGLGLTDGQVDQVEAHPGPEQAARNADYVEAYVRAGGKVKKTVGAFLLTAIQDDYAASADRGAGGQASLFAEAEPPAPSDAAVAAAASEAAADAADAAVDARIAALDERALEALDVEAVAVLRAQGHPHAAAIERAGWGGELTRYQRASLHGARRDAMSARVRSGS